MSTSYSSNALSYNDNDGIPIHEDIDEIVAEGAGDSPVKKFGLVRWNDSKKIKLIEQIIFHKGFEVTKGEPKSVKFEKIVATLSLDEEFKDLRLTPGSCIKEWERVSNEVIACLADCENPSFPSDPGHYINLARDIVSDKRINKYLSRTLDDNTSIDVKRKSISSSSVSNAHHALLSNGFELLSSPNNNDKKRAKIVIDLEAEEKRNKIKEDEMRREKERSDIKLREDLQASLTKLIDRNGKLSDENDRLRQENEDLKKQLGTAFLNISSNSLRS